MAASEPPSRQHILVSIKPSRPWKQCEYSRFHKNRNNLKIATIGWEPVSIIYYTRTESRMKWPTLDTTISCEGWRRHSSLIFLILLFTKKINFWAFDKKTLTAYEVLDHVGKINHLQFCVFLLKPNFYHFLVKNLYKLIQLKRGFPTNFHGNFFKKIHGCNQNHKISHLIYQRKVTLFRGHGLMWYTNYTIPQTWIPRKSQYW